MPAFGSALLVTGPEPLLASRIVADAKAAALREQPGADVNEITATDLEDHMLSEVIGGSLFSTHIVAVIDDLGSCPPEVVEQLVDVARNPPDELCLILVHPGGNKGRGVVDKLKKAKVPTQIVAALKPSELGQFITAEARRAKVRIGAEANQELQQAVGGDLRALAAAVTQLAVDAESGEIDKALIHRYFAGRAEASSFKVADAVLAGNGAVAMENLRWALETGVAPVLITSALAGSFRGMGRLLDAQSRRVSGGELARALGMPPWKIRNLERTSRNWRSGDVAQAIRIVAEGDAAVKGAATDADYALEKMVLAILKLRSR